MNKMAAIERRQPIRSTDPAALVARLDVVLTQLLAAADDHHEQIRAAAGVHRAGATNLVHYDALRQLDLRASLRDLVDLGVISLATAEADAWATVQASRDILTAVSGEGRPFDPGRIDRARTAGDDALAARSGQLFALPRPGRSSRIMATLPGQAADRPELVAAYVRAGLDVVRIDCGRDEPQVWARLAGHVRSAAAAAGRPVAIMMEVGGLRVCTGPIADGPRTGRVRVVRAASGQTVTPARLWLVRCDARQRPPEPDRAPGTQPALTVDVEPQWLAARAVGDVVRLVDARGKRRAFTITVMTEQGALAEGDRSAYIADGALLHCEGSATFASGIPPVGQWLELSAGDLLVLNADRTAVEPPPPGAVARIGCSPPEVVEALVPGQPVHLDDGAIRAVVESVGATGAILRITATKPGGHQLGGGRSITLPETVLPTLSLTALDESYLGFIGEHADILCVPFIRSVADVERVQAAMAAADVNQLGLVLGIDGEYSVRDLPGVLLAAMRTPRLGAMVTAGRSFDVTGGEQTSVAVDHALALCEAAYLPTIRVCSAPGAIAGTRPPRDAEFTGAGSSGLAPCMAVDSETDLLAAINRLDGDLELHGDEQRRSRTLMRRLHD